jgi:acyl carrier protein phosphodiesterase
MTEQKINTLFSMLAMDIFNIKEKLNNQEYIDISNKMKNIKDRYDAENNKKLKIFKSYYQLQKDYIKIGKSFNHLYSDTYTYEDDDNFIDFNLQ